VEDAYQKYSAAPAASKITASSFFKRFSSIC
jgi:hypothetical protein